MYCFLGVFLGLIVGLLVGMSMVLIASASGIDPVLCIGASTVGCMVAGAVISGCL